MTSSAQARELFITAVELATTAPELVELALATFGERLAVASSFGPEDIVLIDHVLSVDRKARIFTLDTGRLHQETYDVIEKVRRRHGVTIEVLVPDAVALSEWVTEHGLNSFYDSVDHRRRCCGLRKVEPLRRHLANFDAWMTGIRRDQTSTRTEARSVERDLMNGDILKINPLVEWSTNDIWTYIRERNLPYNLLHDRGFASIGCVPCTRAIAPGEPERAGRWWWENPDSRECGLHPATTTSLESSS